MILSLLALTSCGGEDSPPTAGDGQKAIAQPLEKDDDVLEVQDLLVLEEKGDLGADPVEILADVTALLTDDSPEVRAHAVHTLGVFGKKSLPRTKSIYPLLVDEDQSVRRAALRSLEKIDPPPEEVLEQLTKVLAEADPQLRAAALHIIAEDGKAAVAPLIKELQNEPSAYWACLALTEIGPEAADAVPALRKVLADDKRPDVQIQAVIALGAIGPAADAAVPDLQALLQKGDPVFKPCVLYALGMIGPAAKPAEELLRKEMASDNAFEKVVAAWALAKVAPEDHPRVLAAAPILVEGLESKDGRVRFAAAQALLDLRPGSAVVQPLLHEALQRADKETHENIIDAIASLGEPAIPTLLKALENQNLRPKVAAILAKMGPAAKEAAPSLADIVESDENPDARREALFALAAMGPDAADEVSAIGTALKDEDEKIRAVAAYTLGKIGPDAMSAKEAIQKQLDDEELPALAAAWALAQIDPQCPETCKKSVPCLIQGLKDPEERIRLEVIAALKRLGPRAQPAADALKQVAEKDSSEAVRQAAAEALKAVE